MKNILNIVDETRIPCIIPSIAGNLHFEKLFSSILIDYFQLFFIQPSISNKIKANINLDQVVEDIESLRKKLRLKLISLLGFSVNGFIVLEYAKKYPQNTARLLLIGAFPTTKDIEKIRNEYWNSFASTKRKLILKEKLSQARLVEIKNSNAFIKNYIANGPRYSYNPYYDTSWFWKNNIVNFEAVNHFDVLFTNYNPTIYFNKIKCPIFIAHGKYDFVVPHILWNNEIKKFKNCTYYLFKKSGHYPFIEEHKNFIEKLKNWLKKY